MATSNDFFRIFDNYPNIDSSSSTSLDEILQKFGEHPANAKKLLDDALEAEYIEPTPSNNPLGVLAYKQRYKITKSGLEVYMVCDDV